MTAIDAEARTPLGRIAVLLPLDNGPRDEDVVEIRAGDLGILYAIAIEFEDWANRHTGRYTDELCVLVGNLHGEDGHDWGDWGQALPYISYEGRRTFWQHRTCKRCKHMDLLQVAEPVATPDTDIWHEGNDWDEQGER